MTVYFLRIGEPSYSFYAALQTLEHVVLMEDLVAVDTHLSQPELLSLLGGSIIAGETIRPGMNVAKRPEFRQGVPQAAYKWLNARGL